MSSSGTAVLSLATKHTLRSVERPWAASISQKSAQSVGTRAKRAVALDIISRIEAVCFGNGVCLFSGQDAKEQDYACHGDCACETNAVDDSLDEQTGSGRGDGGQARDGCEPSGALGGRESAADEGPVLTCEELHVTLAVHKERSHHCAHHPSVAGRVGLGEVGYQACCCGEHQGAHQGRASQRLSWSLGV
eukprot:11926386-Ditylum_brightwellii.AAC.1